jgi:hypothetical protein
VFITDQKGGCSAKSPVALFQEEVFAENTFLSTPLILPRGYSLFIASIILAIIFLNMINEYSRKGKNKP